MGRCSWVFVVVLVVCYTGKAPNAWQRRGTQKTRNTYNQPNRSNQQTSQTKHQALPKGQPGRRITPITQQPCTLQHNNNPPSAPTPDRVITRSSVYSVANGLTHSGHATLSQYLGLTGTATTHMHEYIRYTCLICMSQCCSWAVW